LFFLFLSDSILHPVQFAAHAFDLALCLLLPRGIHLRQSFSEPLAGTAHNGQRYFRIALRSTPPFL
jgi:hypothetical protein